MFHAFEVVTSFFKKIKKIISDLFLYRNSFGRVLRTRSCFRFTSQTRFSGGNKNVPDKCVILCECVVMTVARVCLHAHYSSRENAFPLAASRRIESSRPRSTTKVPLIRDCSSWLDVIRITWRGCRARRAVFGTTSHWPLFHTIPR